MTELLLILGALLVVMVLMWWSLGLFALPHRREDTEPWADGHWRIDRCPPGAAWADQEPAAPPVRDRHGRRYSKTAHGAWVPEGDPDATPMTFAALQQHVPGGELHIDHDNPSAREGGNDDNDRAL